MHTGTRAGDYDDDVDDAVDDEVSAVLTAHLTLLQAGCVALVDAFQFRNEYMPTSAVTAMLEQVLLIFTF